MTAEHWGKTLHAVAVIAAAAGTYLAGHQVARKSGDDQQAAHVQGVHDAGEAVRQAVRGEVRPLQLEVSRMGQALDTLWTESRRADGRLLALEAPGDTTPASSWRSLPVRNAAGP